MIHVDYNSVHRFAIIAQQQMKKAREKLEPVWQFLVGCNLISKILTYFFNSLEKTFQFAQR